MSKRNVDGMGSLGTSVWRKQAAGTSDGGAVGEVAAMVQNLEVEAHVPHDHAALDAERLGVDHLTPHQRSLQHRARIPHLQTSSTGSKSWRFGFRV